MDPRSGHSISSQYSDNGDKYPDAVSPYGKSTYPSLLRSHQTQLNRHLKIGTTSPFLNLAR